MRNSRSTVEWFELVRFGWVAISFFRFPFGRVGSGKVGFGFRVRCITFSSSRSLVLRSNCRQAKVINSWVRKKLIRLSGRD